MLRLFPNVNIKPCRAIRGMSAVLLPFTEDGKIRWNEFEAHLNRTFQNGLVPAVNMDTGFGNLLDDSSKREVLQRTVTIAQGRDFVAGVFIGDRAGDKLDLTAYLIRIEAVQEFGAIPILFPSYGVAASSDPELLSFFERIARHAPRFLGFELGTMFVPCGRIFSLKLFEELLHVRECIGLK
ncbi:MAG: dihydrodipicolinate synthase family protein, partial [bacterium]